MSQVLGSQFTDVPLFTEEEHPTRRIEPHQMSPEQFRAHPDTVFHATYQPLPDVGTSYEHPSQNGGYTGVHTGTEQSALERLAGLGPWRSDPHGWKDSPEGESVKATLHALNLSRYGIDRIDDPISDVAANDLSNVKSMQRPTAYKNDYEDKHSLSVIIPRIPGPVTHSDFVKEAIDNGRRHEVHPRTLALYDRGLLEPKVHYTEARSLVAGTTPEDHAGGLFPFVLKNKNAKSETLASRETVTKDIRRGFPTTMNAREVHSSERVAHYEDSTRDRSTFAATYNRVMGAHAMANRTSADQIYEGLPYMPMVQERVSEHGDIRRGRDLPLR